MHDFKVGQRVRLANGGVKPLTGGAWRNTADGTVIGVYAATLLVLQDREPEAEKWLKDHWEPLEDR